LGGRGGGRVSANSQKKPGRKSENSAEGGKKGSFFCFGGVGWENKTSDGDSSKGGNLPVEKTPKKTKRADCPLRGRKRKKKKALSQAAQKKWKRKGRKRWVFRPQSPFLTCMARGRRSLFILYRGRRKRKKNLPTPA